MKKLQSFFSDLKVSLSIFINEWAERLEEKEVRQRQEALEYLERREKNNNLIS